MSLVGTCERCGNGGEVLHFPPGRTETGGRPTVCSQCKHELDELERELGEPDRDLIPDGGRDELPTPREDALSHVRDALAAVESVPGVALDADKLELLNCAGDDLAALERALTNEVDQQRDDEDEELRTDGAGTSWGFARGVVDEDDGGEGGD